MTVDELNSSIERGLSGQSGRLSFAQVIEVARTAAARNIALDTLETFEIQASSDIPRTDLSIYGPSIENRSSPLSDRIKASLDDLASVARAMAKPGEAEKVFECEIWLGDQ